MAMEEILRSIHAKLIVHEMILSQIMIEASKSSPKNVEFIRSCMIPVEDQLINAARDAPEDKRELVEAARDYFSQITGSLLAQLPSGSKH